MFNFVPNNHHLREVLIFFFYSNKTAAEVHRELQKVYGDAALIETTCRSDPRTWELAAPTIDPTSSWLLSRSTVIRWLNKEDTMSSRHLWWGPPAPTFWDH